MPLRRTVSRGYCELQILCCAERNLLTRLNLDCFSCSGIATHASRALPNLQNPKPRNTDAFTFLEVPGDEGDETRVSGLRVLSGTLLGRPLLLGAPDSANPPSETASPQANPRKH